MQHQTWAAIFQGGQGRVRDVMMLSYRDLMYVAYDAHFYTREKDLISTSGYFQKTFTDRRLETGSFVSLESGLNNANPLNLKLPILFICLTQLDRNLGQRQWIKASVHMGSNSFPSPG